jgi:hypothetical protein
MRLGKPIPTVPAVCERNELFVVQLETEKGSELPEGATETRGGGMRLPGSARSPAARAVPPAARGPADEPDHVCCLSTAKQV